MPPGFGNNPWAGSTRRRIITMLAVIKQQISSANPTKKHGRFFTATQRCLQTAEDICCLITANIVIICQRVLPAPKVSANRGTCFLPMLCETLFVCPKVILRLYPSRRALGRRAPDQCFAKPLLV